MACGSPVPYGSPVKQPSGTCPSGHTVPTSALRWTENGGVCPFCGQPVRPVTGPARMSIVGRVLIIAAVLTALAGVVVAGFLSLSPLPTQQGVLGSVGYCGPGYSSESAVSVLLNPGSVNEGGSGVPDEDQLSAEAEFESLCKGVAWTRVKLSLVFFVAGIVLALPATVISDKRTPGLYDRA